jgi:hypothetical protein
MGKYRTSKNANGLILISDPLYRLWRSIKRRCYVKSDTAYPWYGAKGIEVCAEWRNNFPAFKEWCFVNGYRETLTIDRIDYRGNYSPNNCRFVTMKDQARNRSTSHLITAFGETKTLAAWVEDDRCSITHATIIDRLKKGMSAETAISQPRSTTRIKKVTHSVFNAGAHAD